MIAPLHLRVEELVEPIEHEFVLRGEDLDLEPPDASLEVWYRVSRHRKEVFVQMRLDAALGRTCHRCLEDTVLEIHEELSASLPIPPSGEVSLEQEVRDLFLLGIPMKVLCSPSCKGLCPRCGGNRNRGECSCVMESGVSSIRAQLERVLGRGNIV